MGSLTLPPSGIVYVDANSAIYSVEKIELYNSLLLPMWQGAQAGDFSVVSSELLLLETLVKPLRAADVVLEASFRALLLSSHELRLVSITISILDSAARLRAATGLKTPDAIHAATALAVGCDLFVTNDRDLLRVPTLAVTVLDDIVWRLHGVRCGTADRRAGVRAFNNCVVHRRATWRPTRDGRPPEQAQ